VREAAGELAQRVELLRLAQRVFASSRCCASSRRPAPRLDLAARAAQREPRRADQRRA
jgi:hypothetical protein